MNKTYYEFYTESHEMMAHALTNAYFAGILACEKEYTEEDIRKIFMEYLALLTMNVGNYAGVVD